eukprot:3293458-Amphidinium_carterae.1
MNNATRHLRKTTFNSDQKTQPHSQLVWDPPPLTHLGILTLARKKASGCIDIRARPIYQEGDSS